MARRLSRKTPPRFNRNIALREVRAETGLNQTKFGEAVSLNKSTLQKTEDGDRLLKPNEAELIMAFTGARIISLLEAKKATTLDGRPYTRTAFEQWRRRGVPAAAVEAVARRAGQFVEAMVIAAYGERAATAKSRKDESQAEPPERPQRYREFVESLWRNFSDLLDEYGIRERMEQELQRHSSVENKQMNVESLRKLLAISEGGYAPDGWDREQIAKIPPQRLLNVEITRHPIFNALTGFAAVDGLAAFSDGLLMDKLSVAVKLPWFKACEDRLTAYVFTTWINTQKRIHHEEQTIQVVGGLKRKKKRPTPSAPKAT